MFSPRHVYNVYAMHEVVAAATKARKDQGKGAGSKGKSMAAVGVCDQSRTGAKY